MREPRMAAAAVALAPSGPSKDKFKPYIRALQLRKRVWRKPGDEAFKTIPKTAL